MSFCPVLQANVAKAIDVNAACHAHSAGGEARPYEVNGQSGGDQRQHRGLRWGPADGASHRPSCSAMPNPCALSRQGERSANDFLFLSTWKWSRPALNRSRLELELRGRAGQG